MLRENSANGGATPRRQRENGDHTTSLAFDIEDVNVIICDTEAEFLRRREVAQFVRDEFRDAARLGADRGTR